MAVCPVEKRREEKGEKVCKFDNFYVSISCMVMLNTDGKDGHRNYHSYRLRQCNKWNCKGNGLKLSVALHD